MIGTRGNGRAIGDEPPDGCGIMAFMIALNARYDGKVIVPDTPLALPVNQRLRISIEPIEADAARPPRTNFREWIGLAGGANDGTPQKPHDPGADEDALWEKGPLPRSGSR